MALYNENLGKMTYDNLIANIDVPTKTQTVTIKSGSGALQRGTVLAMSSGTAGTGKCVILGTGAASSETLTAFGILCDNVDATSSDAIAEVYVTGCFNKAALAVKSAYTITADDIKALRDGGIFLENMMN